MGLLNIDLPTLLNILTTSQIAYVPFHEYKHKHGP